MTNNRFQFFLFASCLAFVVLFLFFPLSKQRAICATVPYCDYRCLQLPCITSPSPYSPTDASARDACYPAIANLFVRSLTTDKGIGWNPSYGEVRFLVSLFLAQLVAVVMLSRWLQGNRWLTVVAVMLSPALLSSLYRANPSGWSFALVGIFVCWYDSVTPTKRVAAAAALGLATALKLTPCIWGVLYIAEAPLCPREWRWREIFVASCSALVLVFLPFAFFGGFASIPDFLGNAMAQAQYYSKDNPMWGFVDLVNRFSEVYAIPGAVDIAAWMTRLLSVVLVVSSCFAVEKYKKLLFLGSAMAFLVYHDYGGAYLIPAFFAWITNKHSEHSRLVIMMEAVAWFLMLTPFQIPDFSSPYSINQALQNESLFLLLVVSLFRNSVCRIYTLTN